MCINKIKKEFPTKSGGISWETLISGEKLNLFSFLSLIEKHQI